MASVRPDATLGMAAPKIYSIITDHLQAPRAIYSPSGDLVWSWRAPEAFGVTTPNENPSSLGVFKYDGRFPGQRFDNSTGFLHNGFRSYSPSLGRYLQSDPLGLEAGWNTYAYVGGNPVGAVDPDGLQARPGGGNSHQRRVYRRQQEARQAQEYMENMHKNPYDPYYQATPMPGYGGDGWTRGQLACQAISGVVDVCGPAATMQFSTSCEQDEVHVHRNGRWVCGEEREKLMNSKSCGDPNIPQSPYSAAPGYDISKDPNCECYGVRTRVLMQQAK